jgi:hypothetical protein
VKRDLLWIFISAIISCASVWFAWSQGVKPPREMFLDPVADMNGRVVWGTQRPDYTKPCTVENELEMYPVIKVLMPGAIDSVHMESHICKEHHWRPAQVK